MALTKRTTEQDEVITTKIEQDGEVKYVTHFNVSENGDIVIVSGVFLCGELVRSNSIYYSGTKKFSQ